MVANKQTTLLSGVGCQTLGQSSALTGMAIMAGTVVVSNDGDFAIVTSKLTDSTLAIGVGSWAELRKVA